MGEGTFRVEGMTCSHCEAAVAEWVGRVPGVAGVEVSLAAGTVHVRGDEVNADAVRRAIVDAGYEPAS